MYKKLTYVVLAILLLGLCVNGVYAAIKGADISSLTEQEDFGVVYNECGVQKDLLTILTNRGITLARIRLWTKTPYDLAYVSSLATRCKAAGMQVMLDIHYSDTWADPGTQTKPRAWRRMSGQELIDQVYTYTKDVCTQIDPDYVQIGNEINCGMLWDDGEVCSNGNWATLRDLITAGHNGAKDGGGATTIVHIAPTDAEYTVDWFFGELM